MSDLSGERFDSDVYIPHPPGASSYWENGAPLDAGAAMVFRSNLSKLISQSYRPLVQTIGRGIIRPGTTADTWSGLRDPDPSPTDGSTPDLAHQISWSPAHAAKFPVLLLADRVLAGVAGLGLRRVEALFDHAHRGSTHHLYLYVALTRTQSPPDLGGVLAIGRADASATGGQGQTSITLTPTTAVDAVRDAIDITARAEGGDTRTIARAISAYLWVGWVSEQLNPSVAPTDFVYAVSAWEKP
jgi:hypothetical protein